MSFEQSLKIFGGANILFFFKEHCTIPMYILYHTLGYVVKCFAYILLIVYITRWDPLNLTYGGVTNLYHQLSILVIFITYKCDKIPDNKLICLLSGKEITLSLLNDYLKLNKYP